MRRGRLNAVAEKLHSRLSLISILVIAVFLVSSIPASGVVTHTIVSDTTSVPEGFVAEVFAVNLRAVEDFTFDETGVLWVGSGFTGTVTGIEFKETTPLPIDGGALSPTIEGLNAVFGLAFDHDGNLFLPEFCSGEVSRIDASLLAGPSPINASSIPPLTKGLGCPDGAAFAPSGSPFGTNLFVGDVSLGGVAEINPDNGALTAFTSFSTDIEEVIFSSDGQTMFTITPSQGNVFAMQPTGPPMELAGGFAFPDAIAQGPGNEFGTDLYVGDLHGNTLFRVNPITGETTIFADLGSEFEGFEDIIFDQLGRMYILGFGRGGQIIRIAPEEMSAEIDIDPDILNLKSKGRWITAYIELPEDYNASDIDISTVVLNGEIPAELHPTEIGDYDTDGIIDLMVKFDRASIIELLDTGEVTLTITGEVNGTPFEGNDTIKVIDE